MSARPLNTISSRVIAPDKYIQHPLEGTLLVLRHVISKVRKSFICSHAHTPSRFSACMQVTLSQMNLYASRTVHERMLMLSVAHVDLIFSLNKCISFQHSRPGKQPANASHLLSKESLDFEYSMCMCSCIFHIRDPQDTTRSPLDGYCLEEY